MPGGFSVSRSDKSILLPPRRARFSSPAPPAPARPAVSAVGPQLSPLSHSFRQAPGFCRHASTSAGPAASAVEPQLPPNPKFSPPPVSDKNRAVSSAGRDFGQNAVVKVRRKKQFYNSFSCGAPAQRTAFRPPPRPSPFTFHFLLFTFHLHKTPAHSAGRPPRGRRPP